MFASLVPWITIFIMETVDENTLVVEIRFRRILLLKKLHLRLRTSRLSTENQKYDIVCWGTTNHLQLVVEYVQHVFNM